MRIAFGLLACLVVMAQPAQARDLLLIKYELEGIVDFSSRGYTAPVYGPAVPGPGGTGSMVTFLMDAPFGVPATTGYARIITLVLSRGLTIPYLASGFERFTFNGSPTVSGGLLPGPTLGPFGTLLGAVSGFKHCIASAADCLGILNIPTQQQSSLLPLPATGAVPGGTWALGPGTIAGRMSGIFCTWPTAGGGCVGGSGQVTLVGTEIGRTVIVFDPPEPPALLLLGAALAAGGLTSWRRRRSRA